MKIIEYKFIFENNVEKVFIFRWVDNRFILDGSSEATKLPRWTDLNFHKCPNCPLDPAKIKTCPLSASLLNLVKYFDGLNSYDKIKLEVTLECKKIIQETTVQKGVSAMMGLVSAVSGCPHLSLLKPMAYFHIPLADKENTLYRAVSMYLTAQYFLFKEGKKFEFDLKGLNKIYKNIAVVNSSIARRVREASHTDSAVNAIVTLDIYAKTVPVRIDSSLSGLKDLFESYFNYDISE